MAKKKNSLPEGFEDVDGKIIHSSSKEEYAKEGDDLICISTGEVFEED